MTRSALKQFDRIIYYIPFNNQLQIILLLHIFSTSNRLLFHLVTNFQITCAIYSTLDRNKCALVTFTLLHIYLYYTHDDNNSLLELEKKYA